MTNDYWKKSSLSYKHILFVFCHVLAQKLRECLSSTEWQGRNMDTTVESSITRPSLWEPWHKISKKSSTHKGRLKDEPIKVWVNHTMLVTMLGGWGALGKTGFLTPQRGVRITPVTWYWHSEPHVYPWKYQSGEGSSLGWSQFYSALG